LVAVTGAGVYQQSQTAPGLLFQNLQITRIDAFRCLFHCIVGMRASFVCSLTSVIRAGRGIGLLLYALAFSLARQPPGLVIRVIFKSLGIFNNMLEVTAVP
jgi:hypothetical protein